MCMKADSYFPFFSPACISQICVLCWACKNYNSIPISGTGSGVGTRVLEILKDEFPEVYRFTTAVFPSADDDVITSPYNRSLNQFDHVTYVVIG